jgi:Ca2+/H+ antiporter, TMEM165/GDT1 family
MLNLAQAAPIALAAFIASSVEVVEAFTIVLAVSVVRGVRPAAAGAVAALAVLAAVVAAFGPLLAGVPVHGLQLAVGVLLLVFGLGWLRKAVLRAGGVLALHDEGEAFAKETQALRREAQARSKAADWLAGMVAFKAVLLEGTEVVFIVLAVGARPGLLAPAAIGAAAACVLVLAIGLALRRPLSRIPENSMKFLVGGLLTGFGVFWCCEGLGAPWPGGDWAIPGLVAVYLAAGLALSGVLRQGVGRAA